MGLTDMPERGVRRFDDFQMERRWLAQPIGTVRKYADDRGSALAGLVTFQVFLGMLPLLVVALTIFGGVLEGSERLREAVLESTIGQFPVVGSRIEQDVSALSASGSWIVVSIAGLLWTSAGIYHSLQLALNQVWNVGGVYRQGFVSRHLRAAMLFVLVFTAAVGTSFLRGIGVVPGPPVVRLVVSLVGGWLIASVLLLAVFRLVIAPVIRTSLLVPAALLAGVFWEGLQRLGAWIVMDRLSEARELYGAIGFVVVTLFWINLLARSAVLANEFAVVGERRLWPRRIAQPPLTEADRRVLEGLVNNERRRPEETVEVRFDGDGADGDDGEGPSGSSQSPGATASREAVRTSDVADR
jgi:membrane protein